MSKYIKRFGIFALSGCLLAPVAFAQNSGPVREGLRRTGEAAANVTRGAARATGEAVRRTGEAARNTAQRTRDGVRTITGRDATTDGNLNANQGYTTTDQGYATAEGEQQWDQNQAQTQERYTSNYANEQGQSAQSNVAPVSSQSFNNGRAYLLRHDAQGREFICVCGNRVYFNQQSSQNSSPAPAESQMDNQQAMNSQDTTQPEYRVNRPTMEEQATTESAPPAPIAASAEPQADASASATAEVNEPQIQNEANNLESQTEETSENLQERASDLQSDDVEAPVIDTDSEE